MPHTDTLEAQIRACLAKHAKLNTDVSQLARDADLYQAGLSSHASVNLMLALEGALDIEFPDEFLKRSVFRSIDSIRDAIGQIAPLSA